MTTIVDIRIATRNGSSITPIELLEEFADSTPTWSFLEDDSYHYRATRGRPACVLSHVRYEPFGTVDYAFASVEDREDGSARLVLIEDEQHHTEATVEEQDRLVREFLTAFRSYTQTVHAPVEIETTEREVDPRASLTGI